MGLYTTRAMYTHNGTHEHTHYTVRVYTQVIHVKITSKKPEIFKPEILKLTRQSAQCTFLFTIILLLLQTNSQFAVHTKLTKSTTRHGYTRVTRSTNKYTAAVK